MDAQPFKHLVRSILGAAALFGVALDPAMAEDPPATQPSVSGKDIIVRLTEPADQFEIEITGWFFGSMDQSYINYRDLYRTACNGLQSCSQVCEGLDRDADGKIDDPAPDVVKECWVLFNCRKVGTVFFISGHGRVWEGEGIQLVCRDES